MFASSVGLSLPFLGRSLPVLDLSLPFIDLSLPFVDLSLPFVDLSLPFVDLSLPLVCLSLQSWPNAAEWYGRASVAGNVSAQANLGYCYAHGKGVRRCVDIVDTTAHICTTAISIAAR